MTAEAIISLIALVVAVISPLVSFYVATKVMDARLTRAEKDIQDLWSKMEVDRAAHHADIESVKVMFGEVAERLANMEGMLKGLRMKGPDRPE